MQRLNASPPERVEISIDGEFFKISYSPSTNEKVTIFKLGEEFNEKLFGQIVKVEFEQLKYRFNYELVSI